MDYIQEGGVEPGVMARKTGVPAILNSSADIAGGEEQAWSCEVESCDWRSRHQAVTKKKGNSTPPFSRCYNKLSEYLQCDRPSTSSNCHHDRCRCHFRRSVTGA